MLLGSSNDLHKKTATPQDDQLIVLLINQKRYAEAYRLLIGRDETIENLYNKALCCHASGGYESAISLLEKALDRLTQNLKENNPPKDDLLEKLEQLQFQGEDHLAAITDVYVLHFPIQTKIKCTLLQVKN